MGYDNQLLYVTDHSQNWCVSEGGSSYREGGMGYDNPSGSY